MSLGEWVIVSLLLSERFGFDSWEYWICIILLLVITVALKATGVVE
jgi:hypothetical protein